MEYRLLKMRHSHVHGGVSIDKNLCIQGGTSLSNIINMYKEAFLYTCVYIRCAIYLYIHYYMHVERRLPTLHNTHVYGGVPMATNICIYTGVYRVVHRENIISV
jgi:hypothetical protein